MKLAKIFEKIIKQAKKKKKKKNNLFLIENNEDIKKRKIEKLRDKIEDKILKLDKKIRDEKDEEQNLKLKEERNILKNFRKQLKEKSR